MEMGSLIDNLSDLQSKAKERTSDNPEDNLPDIPTQYDLSVIQKIPTKKIKPAVIKELREEINFKK